MAEEEIIFITGICGYIGSNLARYLLECEEYETYQIHGCDNFFKEHSDQRYRELVAIQNPRLCIYLADLNHYETTQRLLRPREGVVKSIVHTSAAASAIISMRFPFADFMNNAYSAAVLARFLVDRLVEKSGVRHTELPVEHQVEVMKEAALSEDVPKLIALTTNKVYGMIEGSMWVDPRAIPESLWYNPDAAENPPVRRIELLETETQWVPNIPWLREHGVSEYFRLDTCQQYGVHKTFESLLTLDLNASYNLVTTEIRPTTMTGRMYFDQYAILAHGWVDYLTKQICHGKQVTVFGDGKQVRDPVHGWDVLKMIRAIMDKQATEPDAVAGKAFNVGGGPENAWSILDLFELLEEFTGRPVTYRLELPRQADPRWYCSNIELAEKILDWKKDIPIRQIVEELATHHTNP